MQKQTTKLNEGSKTRTPAGKSEIPRRVGSRIDQIHKRIQSKLDDLHDDFKHLASDLRSADQEGTRARKDRLEGFKQALKDILKSADRADREWH